LISNLLPGLRDLRTPLAVGYLWLVALWLALHKYLPASVVVLPALLADAARDVCGIRTVWRSSRRVALSAASSAIDHSSSVLVRPQTALGVKPTSTSTSRKDRPA
jgi:hypothetical protein